MIRIPHRLGLAALLATTVFAAAATAQYDWQQIDELGVKFRVYKDLAGVPLKLGEDTTSLHLRGRYLPDADHNYIPDGLGTIYPWGMEVLEFDLTYGKEKPTTGEAQPKTKAEAEAEAARRVRERYRAKNFLDFIQNKDRGKTDDRKFYEEGRLKKGRGSSPSYTYWIYSDNRASSSSVPFLHTHVAAAYDLGDKEVALIFDFPTFRDDKPDRKYLKIGERMVTSLRLLDDREKGTVVSSSAKKDEYANTPARKAALDKAVANIQSLEGWDYFTSENFICLYSWPGDRGDKQKKMRDFAELTVKQMEDVREQYVEHYPPHEKMQDYWPVIRVCHSKDLFDTYGGTSGGVVGWFNPGSKELVIFYDINAVYGGKEGTKSTAFHEGWHQYADAYFGSAELHRWFDEGTGDYFGCFEKTGRSWKYEPDRGRIVGGAGIKSTVSTKNHVPLKDIVTWNKDKFYGAKAPWYYAQGYAMVDFFRRGEKRLGRKWSQRWSEVLPTYAKVVLETKSQTKAVEAAFDGVDWDELEEAWIDYVKRHITKK